MVTAITAGQSERVARNLPITSCRRLVGVNSSASRAPRSRSPLILSAAAIMQMKHPTEMLASSISHTISLGGMSRRSVLLAITYDHTPSITV